MSTNTNTKPQAFHIERKKGPGGGGMLAVAKCRRCGGTESINVSRGSSGQPLAPIVPVKHFKRRGWKIAVDNAKATCPACQARPKAPNGAAPASNEKESKMTELRPATPAEQRQIFNALEQYFDDEKGAFTAGRSDHSIAAELNVPRALVAGLREEAFGALKIDPALHAVEMKVEALQDAHARFETEMMEKCDAITGQIAECFAEIAKLKPAGLANA